MSVTLSRLTVLAVCIWLGLLFYISTMLVRVQNTHQYSALSHTASFFTRQNDAAGKIGDEDGGNAEGGIENLQEMLNRIQKASSEMNALKQQNDQLKQMLYQSSNVLFQNNPELLFQSSNSFLPKLAHQSANHESLRRSIETNVMELWYRTHGDLERLRKSKSSAGLSPESLDKLKSSFTDQWRVLLSQVSQLADIDDGSEWRERQLRNLTAAMQTKLDRLQNPSDCASARKLLCHLNKGCGFGCQIHHATYCFIIAYATGRTMILDTKTWRYSQKGWNSVFKPTSRTCKGVDTSSAVQWKGQAHNKNDLVVSLPIVDSLRPRPEQLPLSIPQDLADTLVHLHGNPPAWWIGQFIWYLMRYSDDMKKELEATEVGMNFRNPIVGIHVRRTDKLGSEAQFHSLAEYMEWAEHYVRLLDMKRRHLGEKLGNKKDKDKDGHNNRKQEKEAEMNEPVPKRIFLATDDPGLLAEAKSTYTDWEFMGSSDVASSAQLSSRYTDSSLHGLLKDIHFLSMSDYLVCTFSSQVCRVAYELQQVSRGDWANRVHSLDDLFYFGGQLGHEVTAVIAHQPPTVKDGGLGWSRNDQIELAVGDTVGIAGNHWDGWSKGRNVRTGQIGLFPSYKVKEKWRLAPFPIPLPQTVDAEILSWYHQITHTDKATKTAHDSASLGHSFQAPPGHSHHPDHPQPPARPPGEVNSKKTHFYKIISQMLPYSVFKQNTNPLMEKDPSTSENGAGHEEEEEED